MTYNTPLARFVTRPHGDGRSDLLLGSFMQTQDDFFKPNMVYEINKTALETIEIREVGPSLVAEASICDSPIGVSWAMQFQHVVTTAGAYLYLSQEEFEQLP